MLFFIYYSGHGVLNGAQTVGLAVDDSRINLDDYITQLSNCPNTFVIALLDCCRDIVSDKGTAPITEDPPMLRGQHLILYAAGPGKKATAPKGEMSTATAAFLEYMKAYKSTTIDLRRYLLEWGFPLG